MITTNRHPLVKQIRQLQRPRERAATGLFVLEGIRPVLAALENGIEVESLVVAPGLLRSDVALSAVDRIRRSKGSAEVMEVSDDVFGAISGKDRPAGLMCVGRQRWQRADDLPAPRGLGWLGLLQPQDPGNLGTIIRVCDAVGIDAVFVLGESSVDPYHPGALRAAMGATFAVPIVQASFEDFAAIARERGLPVIGTADDAGQDYRTMEYGAPVALVMGRERDGTYPEEQAAITTMVRIPMVGSSDSLNLAISTSLVLYEVFNQQRLAGTAS